MAVNGGYDDDGGDGGGGAIAVRPLNLLCTRKKANNDWHGFLSSARSRGTTAGKSLPRRPRPVDDDDDDDDETHTCVCVCVWMFRCVCVYV